MHVVYKCFEQSGRLLYVGSTSCLERRIQQHKSGSFWASLIATVDVEEFPCKESRLTAERRYIRDMKPAFNLTGNLEFCREEADRIRKSVAESALDSIDLTSEFGSEIVPFVERIEALRLHLSALKAVERNLISEAKRAGIDINAEMRVA